MAVLSHILMMKQHVLEPKCRYLLVRRSHVPYSKNPQLKTVERVQWKLQTESLLQLLELRQDKEDPCLWARVRSLEHRKICCQDWKVKSGCFKFCVPRALVSSRQRENLPPSEPLISQFQRRDTRTVTTAASNCFSSTSPHTQKFCRTRFKLSWNETRLCFLVSS